jgi:glycosyltransferase involved in cell wall biosynthesis
MKVNLMPKNKKSIRVVIDVSHSFTFGHSTGIQRVVKETISSLCELNYTPTLIWHPYNSKDFFYDVSELYATNKSNKSFQLFRRLEKWIINRSRLLHELIIRVKKINFIIYLLDQIKKKALLRRGISNFTSQDFDELLVIDVFWHDKTLIREMTNLSEHRTKVTLFIHDIFPLTNSEWFDKVDVIKFDKSLSHMLKISNKFITSSNSNLGQINRVYSNYKSKLNHLNFKVIPLGSSHTIQITSSHSKTKEGLLWVSTIEPRKNLNLLLDFIENYEPKFPIHICGRPGWKSKETIKRLEVLTQLENVKWHSNATDAEISKIAANAKIGLVTSINEGFGLPILEFRNYGLIVVAPDIEVFREINDDFVVFYESNNLKSLAEICLNKNLQFKPNNLNSNRTWENFTKRIIKFIESE